MKRNGTWLKQKLDQNGFTPADLAAQCDLPLETIDQVLNDQMADESVWDIILDVLNQYPAIMTPAADILEDLKQDIAQYGSDGQVIVYYGVNQNLLGFTGYQNLSDGNYHGANVNTQYLARLTITLDEALSLFQKQNFSLMKF